MLVDNAFFRKIADDPFLTAREGAIIPDHFEQLPQADTLGPLSGKWVHATVHSDLMQMLKAPSDVMKYLQRVNSWIKKNKTVRNPATHFRNVESNYILRDIGGMDFVDQFAHDLKAMRDYAKGTDRFKEAQKAGLFGSDFVHADLTGLDWSQLLQGETERSIVSAARFTERMMNALKTVDNGMTKAYRLEDEIPRLSMYSWLRDSKNYSPQLAVDRVLKVMPDYSDVSPVVEALRKNPLGPTFVTFTAKVLPAYARSIVKHPIRAGKYIVLGEVARQIATGFLDPSEEERERERKAMPEYMRPKVGGAFTPFAKLPVKDRYDRSLFYDLTYSLPAIGDLGETTGMFGLPPVFSIGILPQTALELATNQNWYATNLRGRPTGIWNSRTDSFLEKAAKGSQHLGAQLLPSLTPGVGYGARRLEAAFTGRPNYYGETQDVLPAVGHAVFGQKVIPLDVRLEEQKQLLNVRSQLASIDDEMRSVARNQSYSTLERAKKLRELEEKKRRFVEAYQKR